MTWSSPATVPRASMPSFRQEDDAFVLEDRGAGTEPGSTASGRPCTGSGPATGSRSATRCSPRGVRGRRRPYRSWLPRARVPERVARHRQRWRPGRAGVCAAAGGSDGAARGHHGLRRPLDPRRARRSCGRPPNRATSRRQQVVTVQSRQYSRLPLEVQERLFTPEAYCEMWPVGPDSIAGPGAAQHPDLPTSRTSCSRSPNEKSDHIRLIPEVFDAAAGARRTSPRARARDLRGQPLAHARALRRQVRRRRPVAVRAGRQARAGHGSRPAGEVASCRTRCPSC